MAMASFRGRCLILAMCFSFVSSLESIMGSDGYEAFPSTPYSRYKLYTDNLTWVQAVARCCQDGSGSHLVTLESPDEADVVKTLFARIEDVGVRFLFVGFNDFAVFGSWVSIDGWPLHALYNKWLTGEPNNSGGNEHCGTVTRNAVYNDYRCFWGAPFVCEKPVV